MNKIRKGGLLFILAFLLTLTPAEYAQAKTPAKLGAKDFIITSGGKKTDFIKSSKKDSGYYSYYVNIADKNIKSNVKNFKTNRKVKLGSTETFVKKQYGKEKKIKVSSKERFYKFLKYDSRGGDFSACKTYLEYTYKKSGNNYNIRFYLNKKNKVEAVVYIKNLKTFYNYPNKEINPGISFKAPSGKKVTTKTINGKKVYMVPKGTKIFFKKEMPYEIIFDMYNIYGARTATQDFLQTGSTLKRYYDNNLESMVSSLVRNTKTKKYINTKKLGKYLYFTLRCESNYIQPGKREKAPAIYYFKFV